MHKQPDTTGNYAVALDAATKGIVPIPCYPGTKVPTVRWKRWQHEMPPTDLLERWFKGTRNNIAIICSGMVLFDCEDPATAEKVLAECGDTPHKVRSPGGGVHLGFRKRKGVEVLNRTKVKGMNFDFRTDGGLELIPPSVTADGCYAWLGEGLKPVSELPVAKVGWTRERKRRQVVRALAAHADMDFMEFRAARWLAKADEAVSHENGHGKTFRAACKLIHYFKVGRATAIRLMLTVYNPRCKPPWRPKDIEHKVDSAIERGHAP